MTDRQYYCIRNKVTMGYVVDNPQYNLYREIDSPNEFISVAQHDDIERARHYLQRYQGGVANVIIDLEEYGRDIGGYDEALLYRLRDVELEIAHIRENIEYVTQVVR